MQSDVDVALLQEISQPPSEISTRVEVMGEPWKDVQGTPNVVWKSAVVRTSERVGVEFIRPHIARVTESGCEPIIVMSMYGQWKKPHPSVGSPWIYADASVHALISELSGFIGSEKGHRIIAAGDLNCLYGYGEHGSAYWRKRYDTIFDRMEALGMRYMGPQAPNGRQAEPWPKELPRESKNVPTFHTIRSSPSGATRQLDHVFVSEPLVNSTTVRALNGVDEWGPSDHCRVMVEVEERLTDEQRTANSEPRNSVTP